MACQAVNLESLGQAALKIPSLIFLKLEDFVGSGAKGIDLVMALSRAIEDL